MHCMTFPVLLGVVSLGKLMGHEVRYPDSRCSRYALKHTCEYPDVYAGPDGADAAAEAWQRRN